MEPLILLDFLYFIKLVATLTPRLSIMMLIVVKEEESLMIVEVSRKRIRVCSHFDHISHESGELLGRLFFDGLGNMEIHKPGS
jgi:hypothetical protein